MQWRIQIVAVSLPARRDSIPRSLGLREPNIYPAAPWASQENLEQLNNYEFRDIPTKRCEGISTVVSALPGKLVWRHSENLWIALERSPGTAVTVVEKLSRVRRHDQGLARRMLKFVTICIDTHKKKSAFNRYYSTRCLQKHLNSHAIDETPIPEGTDFIILL